MKHTLTITVLLVSFFLLAQVFGLFLIAKDANISTTIEGNKTITTVAHNDTAVGPRPETEGAGSFLYVAIGVLIGTLLVLLLARFGKTNLWKIWYFIAVWMAMSISLGVLIKQPLLFDYGMAIGLALALAIWKIFKPNIFVHNITEVFIYAGIALLLVPLFNVLWAVILLLAISLYDMYAVWKSKHMITMAKFQTQSNVFAGLMIPYRTIKMNPATAKKTSGTGTGKAALQKPPAKDAPKTAILGGGDIAFPLIFTGTVFEELLREGLTKSVAYLHASIIIATATIAIALLFFSAKKGKFYPAMPFLTLGCLIGWGIVLII